MRTIHGATRRLVVIGGVAAGMSAAAEARRVDPKLHITVVERGALVSYAKCSLPLFVEGTRPSPYAADRPTADRFRAERNIDVRIRTEALRIDTVERFVRVRDLERGGEFNLDYDRLILATGGRLDAPEAFPAAGNLHAMLQPDDAVALDERLRAGGPLRHAAVIGAGAIGVEMARVFRARGIPCTLYETRDRLFGDVSPEIDERLRAILARQGVAVRSGLAGLAGVYDGPRLVAVRGGGFEEPCDLGLLATGQRPETTLARAAGIGIGRTTGGITIDLKMQASAAGVYAAGDCAEFRDGVTGRPTLSRVGTTAFRSGYVAGANAAGEFRKLGGIYNTAIARVFGFHLARTGLGFDAARAFLGAAFERTAVEHRESPGAEPARTEIYFERRSGKIVGAQLLGDANLKRIDLLGLAMRENIPLARLGELDFAYAPDYSSARDPLFLSARDAAGKERTTRR